MRHTADTESAAALSAATTLSLRDRMDATEALTDCRTPFQDIVGLAKDRFASLGEDMRSSEVFAEVELQQNGNGLMNDNTEVNKLLNPASDGRNPIPETEKSNSSPQSCRLLEQSNGYRIHSCYDMITGVGVVHVDARREGVAGARQKRKPTTKRRRCTRNHPTNPLQSAAIGTVNTTVSVPN